MTALTKIRLGYLAAAAAVACFIAAIAVECSGCATPADLTPATGPGTDYPCGVSGVLCATQHACCNEYETCGGEPASVGCPPGACCDIGSGDEFARRRPPHPQRRLP